MAAIELPSFNFTISPQQPNCHASTTQAPSVYLHVSFKW